ncbi:polysaccharide deacetylase family protein [Chryseobacterium sp. G0201]|uniref:polysaccharide deacetylase family protein n=1 Tax=Chryseobacterium sp. G0201 TaxID=2487065 RepID=UPI0013DE20F9|nr:polysaccharide deacetylase family protein [Chryseobacterium sp. G0201]
MYHNIHENSFDDLSVEVSNLDKQFKYLNKRKYTSIFFSEIHHPITSKVIITFDDGYKNNFDYLPDLLAKHNLKAVLFISTHFIQHGYDNNIMMTFEELRSLPSNLFEIGLHSHSHKDFRTLTMEQAEDDLKMNMKILNEEKINYCSVFAYPYGKYIKEKNQKEIFFNILKKLGINVAVRIGNKVNSIKTTNPFEVCRIDIKGQDSLIKFKLKLILGKLNFF